MTHERGICFLDYRPFRAPEFQPSPFKRVLFRRLYLSVTGQRAISSIVIRKATPEALLNCQAPIPQTYPQLKCRALSLLQKQPPLLLLTPFLLPSLFSPTPLLLPYIAAASVINAPASVLCCHQLLTVSSPSQISLVVEALLRRNHQGHLQCQLKCQAKLM